jgi:hypothetical protein
LVPAKALGGSTALFAADRHTRERY